MKKLRGVSAAVVVPAVLLVAGAGMGVVVAKERSADGVRSERTGLSGQLTDQLREAVRTESKRNSSTFKKKPCKKGKKCKKPAPKPKFMAVGLADQRAEDSARRAWINDWDDIEWDDYGTADCRRLSRSAVSCVAWVEWLEVGYEDSDYDSLYGCEWWVTSRWVKKGGSGKRGSKPKYRLQVNDGRRNADCEYY